MPLIRINAKGSEPRLHCGTQPLYRRLAEVTAEATRDEPVIVMIHGYKYRPGMPDHCPHLHLMAMHPRDRPWHSPSWPRQLGFGTGHANEGLGIAFGWDARGPLWSARRRAIEAGRALAQLLNDLRRQSPYRPVHLLAHSMGTEVALQALDHLPANAIQRIVSLTGASYRETAQAALETAAGQTTEFFNITSRENDTFDFLFERLVAPPVRGDRAIGLGLDAPNAVTLQLDCTETLGNLHRLGAPMGNPERRICHWSTYTRAGTLRFYNDLMRNPARWPLNRLQQAVPEAPARRWSRLVAPPAIALPLLAPQKAS